MRTIIKRIKEMGRDEILLFCNGGKTKMKMRRNKYGFA